MKPIKFKKNCNYKGKEYVSGDILTDISDFSSIWKLNETGFIESITESDFIRLQKENVNEEGQECKKNTKK